MGLVAMEKLPFVRECRIWWRCTEPVEVCRPFFVSFFGRAKKEKWWC